ncbi:MAG: hypothetical protein LR015_14500 [Verrucomicrobia bacterium]|nr:hypothetical protein [Verrucomicrobiota bacterium]
MTRIVLWTNTSTSNYAAQMIWWEKEDFLSEFDQNPLAAQGTTVSLTATAPARILIRTAEGYFISQSPISGTASLEAQAWGCF